MSLQKDIEDFFTSPLANRAASGMKDGSKIAIFVDDKPFLFSRILGKNICKPGKVTKPELIFWLTTNAMQKISHKAQEDGVGLGELGITIFEGILLKQEENKIRFAIHGSFLTLWTKGYFSVLKKGGPELSLYLAKLGFTNIAQWRKIFKKA
jgi:hypothetical protein